MSKLESRGEKWDGNGRKIDIVLLLWLLLYWKYKSLIVSRKEIVRLFFSLSPKAPLTVAVFTLSSSCLSRGVLSGN